MEISYLGIPCSQDSLLSQETLPPPPLRQNGGWLWGNGSLGCILNLPKSLPQPLGHTYTHPLFPISKSIGKNKPPLLLSFPEKTRENRRREKGKFLFFFFQTQTLLGDNNSMGKKMEGGGGTETI